MRENYKKVMDICGTMRYMRYVFPIIQLHFYIVAHLTAWVLNLRDMKARVF